MRRKARPDEDRGAGQLPDPHTDIDASVRKPQAVTVQEAAEDRLTDGLDGRSSTTVRKHRDVLMAVLVITGRKRCGN